MFNAAFQGLDKQSEDLQKNRALLDYSRMVDLRTQKNQTYDQTFNGLNRQTINFDTNTNVLVDKSTGNGTTKLYANNNSTITMDFKINDFTPTSLTNYFSVFQGNYGYYTFGGNGKFIINANVNNGAHLEEDHGFLDIITDAKKDNLNISASMVFKASGNLNSFLRVITGSSNGNFYLNTPLLEVDIHNNGANANTGKYFLNTIKYYSGAASIYLNADPNNPSQAHNQNNILKITGDIKSTANTKLYAHFSNAQSYLNGNVFLGSGSTNLVFSNGALANGNIDFIDDKGSHNITFDQASFIGHIKDTSKKNNSDAGYSANTTITFKNTAGKTFGDNTNDIVDAKYKGTIIANFDLSQSSTTSIKGGSDGSKGFFGTGTNLLTFDFRNNATSNLTSPKFSIGGGNTDSVYVFNGLTEMGKNEFDLSNTTTSRSNDTTNTNSLFSKIKTSGIQIQEGATQALNSVSTSNPTLKGTLFFKNTNIKVNTDDNALFAKKENILVTSSNNLDDLAFGAMFGNATWIDTNSDKQITADEIISNNGVTYKLTSSSSSDKIREDSKTSSGNIGKNSDGIKKQIAFIFANGDEGYTFNGNTQGYSGTIKGGTADSAYYFANAGYLDRNQIEEANGNLVLFNTALRGDLGVKNKDVSILLDFSSNKNGLAQLNTDKSTSSSDNANIVGSGNKNIVFNFTDNTLKEKYKGAVVGDATKTHSSTVKQSPVTDNNTATYTMLNLKKYTSDGTIANDDGMLVATASRGTSNKTLIDAIKDAGLTNFNNPEGNNLKAKYSQTTQQAKTQDNETNIENLSKTATTLSLRGTSLDATNMNFNDYKYDLAFGSGLGEMEGITIQDSKLKGTIDFSSNTNTGHKIIMRGNSIAGNSVEIKFKNISSLNATFVYNDSTATQSSITPTLKLSGISQSNYLTTNSELSLSNTNLEGNIWADNQVSVNLNFTNGKTWKMQESGMYLKNGSNIVVHGEITNLNNSRNSSPSLKIKNDGKLGDIQLVNTNASLTLFSTSNWDQGFAKTLYFRGTTLNVSPISNDKRLKGAIDSGGIKMVFAKGNNLETIITNSSRNNTPVKITDKEANTGIFNGAALTHSGSYKNGIYDGNYIAQSSGDIAGIDTNSGFNLTFIGENAWTTNEPNIAENNYYTADSTLIFTNASTSGTQFSAKKIGKFFKRATSPKTIINIEGTSLKDADNLVQRNTNQDKLTFNMTFIKDETASRTNKNPTYIDSSKYSDLATTNASGALADKVLKVAQSSLEGGIDFKDSNFNVLFVGNASQNLNETKIFKGGSASSIVTFRNTKLNAGKTNTSSKSTTSSSMQNIKGTIAFDLSHTNETIAMSGTLSNMFGVDSTANTNTDASTYNGTGKYQTIFKEGLAIDKLVFVKANDISDANTLKALKTQGKYFNDTDTFATLADTDYSAIGQISDLGSSIADLTFQSGEIVLKGTNQELIFIGKNSHGFGKSTTTRIEDSNVLKLGDSTGSALSFIDAGELKIANLINKDTSGVQQGKGTINLIGSTKIELKDIPTSTRSNGVKTLTLYDATTTSSNSSDRTVSSSPITGKGITINAVFTGNNFLGDGVEIKKENSTRANTEFASNIKGSNVNIGQAGEETTYHILFDYTDAMNGKENLGFGKYQVYQGNIAGLKSDSIIKFKNSGYINESQISATEAVIYLDNTQLKGDFRKDIAVLDFRNNRPSVSGNILTSSQSAGNKNNNFELSRKILTFDLTNSTQALNFTHAIQAGYKIAPDYTQSGQSILTFQNSPTLTLGDDTATSNRMKETNNSSVFIQALAQDAGFSQIATAKTTEPSTTTQTRNTEDKTSYILAGTKLTFEGTNIKATQNNTITENLYELDLRFDNRGQTRLGENLKSATLQTHSIAMGSFNVSTTNTRVSSTSAKPLGLSLAFYGKDSLKAENKSGFDNVLSIKLQEGARFNLVADSANGNIGTIVLTKNTATQRGRSANTLSGVDSKSSLDIAGGSMNFVGDFKHTAPNTTNARNASQTGGDTNTVGNINVNFDGINKVYGSLAGRGEMNVNIKGDALLSHENASFLGFSDSSRSGDNKTALLLDASNATSSNIVLAHTKGTIEIKGKEFSTTPSASLRALTSLQEYTTLSLNDARSNVIVGGAFDIGNANINFSGGNQTLTLSDNTYFKVAKNVSITLKNVKLKSSATTQTSSDTSNKILAINAMGNERDWETHLTLTNFDEKIIVKLTRPDNTNVGGNWGHRGEWDIRGVNIDLDSAFYSNPNLSIKVKKLVFAKGHGREVADLSKGSTQASSATTLDQLAGDDKINASALSGNLRINPTGTENRDVANVGIHDGSFTFIGKEALAVDPTKQWIDGINSGHVDFGFFNSILKSGSIILDNTNAASKKNVAIQDIALLRGTDTFNLSLQNANVSVDSSRNSTSINQSQGSNNSIINAVFINNTDSTSSEKTRQVVITGEKYIDATKGSNALKATLAQYALSNASGALSDNILKVMQSKAYGNIVMQSERTTGNNQGSGVTATMKFIGENSHSFDGKTIVEGSGTSAKFYQYVGSKTEADIPAIFTTSSNTADWKEITIDTQGKVMLGNTSSRTSMNRNNIKYAQLIGGNANSRFDFDHTTVALDLVKFAGGKTIVYNSKVSGQIAVKANSGVGNSGVIQASDSSSSTLNILNGSSTTIFFNAKMTENTTQTLRAESQDQALSQIAKNYIDYHYGSAETGLGINLDLSKEHQMTKANLTASSSRDSNPTYTLGATEKQTNIILIGKNSVKTENASASISSTIAREVTSNNNGQAIDLSFLPSNIITDTSSKYAYTIISGGDLDGNYINTKLGNNTTQTSDASGATLTIFGKSKVTLVDTYVIGQRDFAQVGFINTADVRNQKSSWGGGESIEQFLIFDFHKGENNNKLNNGNEAIKNNDTDSRYIFTNIFKDGVDRVLTLSSANSLKSAINTQLKSTKNVRTNNSNVIGNDVKGYLGLRGVSIAGSIDESLTTTSPSQPSSRTNGSTSGNSVDIVFNSTSDISYIDGFDESGQHTFEIKRNGQNKIANITGSNTDISGYAVFKASSSRDGSTSLEIKGSAHKDIVFIGENTVVDANGKRAFDSLKISEGSANSNYTFYAVGSLGDTFLQNVKLQKTSSAKNNTENPKANLGVFTFAGGTQIRGDINVDAPSNTATRAGAQVQRESKLIFDNVIYSGSLSGTLSKGLKFAKGSNNIKISVGSDTSIYDFSNLSNESIRLDINMTKANNTNNTYYAAKIVGFDGNTSLVGSLKLAQSLNETSNPNSDYSNAFVFNNNAKWTMTQDSRVMNLSLNNAGIGFNLDLSSASRVDSVAKAKDSKDLRVLEVGNLNSNGGQVLLGTNIDSQTQSNSKSDKIKASVISYGTLYVTAKDTNIATGNFDTSENNAIVLITAQSAYGEIKGAQRKEGLSYVSTTLEHQVSSDNSPWIKVEDESVDNSSKSHRWVLAGFDSKVNQELVDESGFLVSNPYRMLLIESNNLNKRMGDLRDNAYNQGAWIRVFNGSDSGEGIKNLYTNIQLGYDYGTPAIGAKNYSGVAFSTSIVDINGNQYSGKANTYSLSAYNAYIADSGLYVDIIAKYLYTDQKLNPSEGSNSNFGNHALSLGVEVGYRAYMGETNFYFETQAELIGGLIIGVKDINLGIIGGRSVSGELETTTALNARVGVVQGYSLKTQNGFRADFRLGASLINEYVSNNAPIRLYDGITEAGRSIGNDIKAVLNIGTNLILTDQWRVYIDAERSFGGSRNTDYQANIGARFSFGDKVSSLAKSQMAPLKLKDENK